jgi:long-chain acyl-CoA synthetase
MNIAHWLDRTARTAGHRPALFTGGNLVADYAGFHRMAAGVASALMQTVPLALAPGDRVGLFMANRVEYLIALYAIWIAGAAAVPINARLHPREAAWILADSGAQTVFTDADHDLTGTSEVLQLDVTSPAFREMTTTAPMATCDRQPADLAWLFYTSGTTGNPKGVQITHGMIAAMSLAYPLDVDPVSPEDATLYAAPMSHGAGLYAPIHVHAGARHICPATRSFDAAEVLALAAQAGRVSMFMAPTMARRLTDHATANGLRGEGIRTIVYAGGPMYEADILQAVGWFGPKFVQIYGQGECPMAITALPRHDVADRVHPRWRERLGSVGRAQSLVALRVAGADGRALPTGEVGEIMVSGLPVMPGYWQNPAATAATLRDGWLLTGDMGRLDEDGYLTLVDRSKDLIISGGSNIYPREVEEVLLRHPTVQEASVIGKPSAEWGEDVVAFVVAVPGASIDPETLDAHCRQEIARFKRPKLYIVLPELPKNNYGKVLKTELRRHPGLT